MKYKVLLTWYNRKGSCELFMSPKQRLETCCFCSVLLLLLLFSFLSLRHERVHGRFQELLDIIS